VSDHDAHEAEGQAAWGAFNAALDEAFAAGAKSGDEIRARPAFRDAQKRLQWWATAEGFREALAEDDG
jgi:hypothetical protein